MRYQSPYNASFAKAILIVTFFFSSSLPALAEHRKANIVATIKPIEGLIRAIAEDTVNIQRLIPDYASLHNYHFRPSDIRKLNNADIIFRIDENMENFLTPLLSKTPDKVHSLADAPNMTLLPINQSFMSSLHSHDKETHTHQHSHDDHNVDLHIWMSPQNGVAMAAAITHVLSQLQPQHSKRYQQNFKQLSNEIDLFNKRFMEEAKGYKNTPYLVFHDSWRYFSHAFKLKKLATINLNAEVQAGARTLYRTRQQIKRLHAHCLFSEPNFRPKTINTLIEGFEIKTAEIDSLASHLTTSPRLYLDLMQYTAEKVKACLS